MNYNSPYCGLPQRYFLVLFVLFFHTYENCSRPKDVDMRIQTKVVDSNYRNKWTNNYFFLSQWPEYMVATPYHLKQNYLQCFCYYHVDLAQVVLSNEISAVCSLSLLQKTLVHWWEWITSWWGYILRKSLLSISSRSCGWNVFQRVIYCNISFDRNATC